MDGAVALGLVALLACAACSRQAADPAFAAEWRTWHERREERLRAADGWLALVGLHWLEEGENRVEGLPGTFVVSAGAVTLRASPADGYRLGGEPVAERRLASDAAEKPDRLVLGPRQVQVIDRSGRLALRVWDSASPVLTGFRGIDTFEPDPRWRVEATWEPYAPPKEVSQPSVTGTPTAEKVPGRARFTLDGKEYALEPTADGENLFFVFKDGTARKETYGAGRFLYAPGPKDGKVVLDFNRAYNPPCAFTPHATCPLPRPENVLAVRIEAGEKRFGED
jgi:uncharacterized protein (DUF1684 family)